MLCCIGKWLRFRTEQEWVCLWLPFSPVRGVWGCWCCLCLFPWWYFFPLAAALLSAGDRVASLTDGASQRDRRTWGDGWSVPHSGMDPLTTEEMIDAAANFKHRELNRPSQTLCAETGTQLVSLDNTHRHIHMAYALTHTHTCTHTHAHTHIQSLHII